MTITLETPAVTTHDTPAGEDTQPGHPGQRGLPLLSKSFRATGHGRVGLGPLAAAVHDGHPVRLVVPIERVAAVDVRARFGGPRVNINVHGPTELAPVVTRAAEAALTRFGHTGAELHFELRLPPHTSTGTDLAEAVALGTLDAVTKTCDSTLDPAARSAIAASVLGGRSAGLAGNAPTIVTVDGQLRPLPAATATLPRLLLVVCTPAEAAQDTRTLPDDATFGDVTAPSREIVTSADLAAWLTDCSGEAQHPVADAVRQLTTDSPRYLGVIGGHTATAPVAVLVDPADMAAAQTLLRQLPAHLPKGWRSSITRTAAASH